MCVLVDRFVDQQSHLGSFFLLPHPPFIPSSSPSSLPPLFIYHLRALEGLISKCLPHSCAFELIYAQNINRNLTTSPSSLCLYSFPLPFPFPSPFPLPPASIPSPIYPHSPPIPSLSQTLSFPYYSLLLKIDLYSLI